MTRIRHPLTMLAIAALATPVAAQVAPPAPPAPPVYIPVPAAKSPSQMTPEELAAWKKANGSYYVQCDGQPDNMSGGEQAARLVGALALVGLLAPAPEAADPAKRKFGAAGVAACTALLEGDKRESSAPRRIGLIMARALHRIEAKDYAGAITDAALARTEATGAGLMADPYYARSRGHAPDLIEAAALYRLHRDPEARSAGLRGLDDVRHSLFDLLPLNPYRAANRGWSDVEGSYYAAQSALLPYSAVTRADRLEEMGRFDEAAAVRDALLDFAAVASPKVRSSALIAQAAVSHALAGHGERAATLAAEARANFDRRKADGKPDPNPAEFVELMDLYHIVGLSSDDPKAARRLFAARSEWVAASFGSTVEMTRRLRAGASADERIGGLSRDPDQLWQARADAEFAKAQAGDADNKTLFAMMIPSSSAGSYEAQSKKVWNTAKSSLLLKPRKVEPDDASRMETLFLYGVDPRATVDAYSLHAALLAKARGAQGFVIAPLFTGNILAARVLTGNRGEPGLPPALFNDADQVVAALSPIIPSPDALKARKAAQSRTKR